MPPPSSLPLRWQSPTRAGTFPTRGSPWNRPCGIGALVLVPPAAEIVVQEHVGRLGREWDTQDCILGAEEERVVAVVERDFQGMQAGRQQEVQLVVVEAWGFQGKQVGRPQLLQWFQHF